MAISERLALLVSLDAQGAIKSFNDLGKAADKNLSKADQRLDRMGSKFQKAGAGMLATAGLLGVGLYKAGQAASDLEQAVGGTEAVFGEASDAIDEFAKKAARSAGLSEAAFRSATTSIGGQLKGLGYTTSEAADQSIRLTKTAADLAATYGGTTAEAVQALGAALRGEADPAERFNLFLNQNRVNAKAVELGLAATTSQVDAHAKAQATLALVLEQSADAQGQFARESGTAAGQMQIASAEIENAKASLGESVAPVLADVAGGLADLAGGFTNANEATDGFIGHMAALGTVGLGAAGGLSFVAGKVIDMRDRFGQLSGSLRNAEGGFNRLGRTVGALGLAGAAFGIVQIARAANDAKVDVDAFTSALADSTDASEKDLKAKLYAADAVGALDDIISQTADSNVIAAEKLIALADAAGVSSDKIRELRDITESKRESDVQGAKDQEEYASQVDSAKGASEGLTTATENQASATDTAAGAAGGLTDEVKRQKDALDLATESADKFKAGIDAAFGDLTLEEAVDRRSQDFQDMADKFADAQENVKSAKQHLDELLATPKEDRGDNFAAEVKDAQKALAEATAETSRALDGNTDAALRNRDSIRGAVDDVAAVIQAHRDEGDSLEELQGIREIEKANLERQLEQLGFNRDEIGRYIDAIDAIPITKDTTITVDTAPAQLRIKELAESLKALAPSQQFSIDAAIIDRNLQRASTRRAIGGPVTAGEAYSVNEYLGAGKGFEWFAPSNGTITPSGAAAGTNSYAFDVTINNPVPEPASTSIGRLRRVSLEVASR